MLAYPYYALMRKMKAVKMPFDAGEFDEDMEIEINKSNESSNSLENEQSGIFFNCKMLIKEK